jgi:hypothetical protein
MMAVIQLTVPVSFLFEDCPSIFAQQRPAMAVHSTAFEAEQPARLIRAADAVLSSDQIAFVPRAVPAASRELNPRTLLTTGAALAVLAAAGWYGWDYRKARPGALTEV